MLTNGKWYKEDKKPSELRYDVVSKDWVVVATGRAQKPENFKRKRGEEPLEDGPCPFEDLSDQEAPTIAFHEGERVDLPPDGSHPPRWTTISILNKFPAFTPTAERFVPKTRLAGPYQAMPGHGFHEVIITREHDKDIPQFTLERVTELVSLYQQRYLDLQGVDFVQYVSIFKNKGPKAGASLAHPHSQLIGLPITDPDVDRSLKGSREYYEATGRCPHCAMLEWDFAEGKRIVFENKRFAVVCPFASRVPFETRVYPKEHSAYFQEIPQALLRDFAEALWQALKRLHKGLNDPDYNYFIHTAPADGVDRGHYHWHLEILPRERAVLAGFELGAGIEISTIEPEKAAAFLRSQ